MYAVFTEVNADESHLEAGCKFLNETAVPMVKVGDQAGPDPAVTFTTVEVREVIASL